MTAPITQVVKQFQQDWTTQMAPEAILAACRDVAYRWRERMLDPVTTIQLFCVQILHGNTACTHLRHLTQLNVTASAYCQARMKLPLTVFQHLLRSVSHALQHEPLEEGRGQPRSAWLQQLGQHDQLVHWLKPLAGPQWMNAEQFAHLSARLEVREL
jgi:hypothetical protein